MVMRMVVGGWWSVWSWLIGRFLWFPGLGVVATSWRAKRGVAGEGAIYGAHID
jgi:hypothetical protein